MCTHKKICCLDMHFMTCVECGLVLTIRYVPHEMQLYEDYVKAPLSIPYTRIQRFKKMLDSICLGLEQTADKRMFQHLVNNSCRTKEDILRAMKSSSLVDKRFCSLHVFMKCFCPNELSFPDTYISRFHQTKKHIYKAFSAIDFKLSRENGRFLNYRFVIDVLLWWFKFDSWRCFIKPLKCPKRVLKCITLLNSLHISVHDITVVIPDTFVMSSISFFRQA